MNRLFAVVFGRIDTENHPKYIEAKQAIVSATYRPSRTDDLIQQSELVWKMADEGLMKIHERMDRLLVTALASAGLFISASKVNGTPVGWLGGIAIVFLLALIVFLLLNRLPIVRFAPTELDKLAEQSVEIAPEDPDWEFAKAYNYYLARIECDIAADVLANRMRIAIGLFGLVILFASLSLI